jgi:Hint domain
VETLEKGDLVLTPDGPAPVIWSGLRGLGRAELEADPDQLPIHFDQGAIGNALPLRLSPQHAVQILGVDGNPALVRAKHLATAGLRGVRIARGVRSVTYHHLLLEQHTILSAAGALVETMYPGRVALAAFPPAARLAIAAAIYSVRKATRAQIVDLLDLSDIYGPRCFPLLSRRESLLACQKGTKFASFASRPSQFGQVTCIQGPSHLN